MHHSRCFRGNGRIVHLPLNQFASLHPKTQMRQTTLGKLKVSKVEFGQSLFLEKVSERSEYWLHGFLHHSLSTEIKVVDKKCFHGDLASKHLYLYIFIPQVVSLDSMSNQRMDRCFQLMISERLWSIMAGKAEQMDGLFLKQTSHVVAGQEAGSIWD